MRIDRDIMDRIDQPTVEENIEKANSQLDKLRNRLYGDKIPTWVARLIISIFKGGVIMDKTILAFLKTVMDNTEIDEQVYKIASDQIKETIPGDEYEPMIGEILVGLGNELQKK